MCGTQQEGWRFPGGSQEAPVRRYACKIPPFCEEVFWILCPNCKPWHSRQESANFDRGGGLCRRQVVLVWTGAGWVLRGGFPPGPGRGSGRVLRTLRVVAAFSVPRGAAPRGPACPAGSPFLPRNGEKEGRGPCPLDPRFYGPLVPTRSFWRLCRIVPVVGLLRGPCTCPDLETFFRENSFQHIFLRKMRPKSVLAYRKK